MIALGRVPIVAPSRGRTTRTIRSRARRAVGSFLLAYAVGTIGFLEVADATRPSWWDAESTWRHRRLRETVAAANGRPAVAVFGSSRSQMGFSPRHVLDGAGMPGATMFNASAAGAGPYRHLVELRRTLDRGVRPTAVLVEMLPLHLSRDGRAHADTLLADAPACLSRTDFATLAPHCRDPIVGFGTWARARATVWAESRRALAGRYAPWLLPDAQRRSGRLAGRSATGWVPYDNPNMSAEERGGRFAVAEREYRRELGSFAFDPDADRVYAEIVRRGRERGVAVAFFLMPESPSFRAFAPPDTRAAIRAFLARVSESNGVPVFDATDWVDDEGAFADGHHLLAHGAGPFGLRFGRECVGPWLASLDAVVP